MKIFSKTFGEIAVGSALKINNVNYTVNVISLNFEKDAFEIEIRDEEEKIYVLSIKDEDVIASITDKTELVDIKDLELSDICVEVEGKIYYDLEDAMEVAKDGKVIKFLKNTARDGIKVESGENYVFDLNGFTLTIDKNYVGSAGTETNGFQLLKDSNVVIKNGILNTTDAKIMIQNYSDLILDNVKVYGSEITKYVVSNNYGSCTLKNGTIISAREGNCAFDLYYGMGTTYDEGVTVKIEDNSVKIRGRYEYGRDPKKTEEDMFEKAILLIPTGYPLSPIEGTKFKYYKGMQRLVKA